MPVAESATSTTPATPANGRSAKSSSKSGVLISLAVHCVTLVTLALATFATEVPDVSLGIESLFADPDRGAEEVTQQLNTDTPIAETINFVAGGATAAGAAAGGAAGGGVQVSEQKIDRSESLTDVAVVPNLGASGLPGLDRLGDDLGSEQVLGEAGALVEGYGPALDRLTQE
ncbi:MAG: hypothetical protein ACK6D3_12075, partial [Planctomycetaceae bacterium]